MMNDLLPAPSSGVVQPIIAIPSPAGSSSTSSLLTGTPEYAATVATQMAAAGQAVKSAVSSMPPGASGNIWSSPMLFLAALGVAIFMK